jgi:hypothetical protein
MKLDGDLIAKYCVRRHNREQSNNLLIWTFLNIFNHAQRYQGKYKKKNRGQRVIFISQKR